jgi:hypothetical protein
MIADVSSGFASLTEGFGVAAINTLGCLLTGNLRTPPPNVELYFAPFLFGVERRVFSVD